MVSIKPFCFNAFSENTYLIYEPQGECIIIDPGCYEPQEYNLLKDFVNTEKLTPVSIVNTHCHVDHVLGVQLLKEFYHIPFCIHETEVATLKAVKLYAPVYGFLNYTEPEPDRLLKDGESIILGSSLLEVIYVPGHSSGHIALYESRNKICISGDILFRNSIGRTDLPGGDFNRLIHGIKTRLFSLPEDVTVYPGHGPATTVGEEKQFNPFCGIGALS